LIVDPCIPSAWDGFTVTRRFRGATYVITVRNPNHICRGVRQMQLDGRPIDGNRLPILGDGQIHQVDVVLAV
jgi:cellobiose phosphorylase